MSGRVRVQGSVTEEPQEGEGLSEGPTRMRGSPHGMGNTGQADGMKPSGSFSLQYLWKEGLY